MKPNEAHGEARKQPFGLFLRTVTGDGRVLLRCLSPIGVVAREDEARIESINQAQQKIGIGKICAVDDIKRGTYNLTVETDIMFHAETTQPQEVVDLVSRTTHSADQMEQTLLQMDEPMDTFRVDIIEEPQRG